MGGQLSIEGVSSPSIDHKPNKPLLTMLQRTKICGLLVVITFAYGLAAQSEDQASIPNERSSIETLINSPASCKKTMLQGRRSVWISAHSFAKSCLYRKRLADLSTHIATRTSATGHPSRIPTTTSSAHRVAPGTIAPSA